MMVQLQALFKSSDHPENRLLLVYWTTHIDIPMFFRDLPYVSTPTESAVQTPWAVASCFLHRSHRAVGRCVVSSPVKSATAPTPGVPPREVGWVLVPPHRSTSHSCAVQFLVTDAARNRALKFRTAIVRSFGRPTGEILFSKIMT